MERYEARTMSSAQLRKIKKPIIERRRRERINDSLNQLKTLLLDALQKDEAENSKMEKADILELAVSYLQNIKNSNRHQQPRSSSSSEKLTARYQAGYGACAREVGRYLNRNQAVDPRMASRVAGHVSSKMMASSPMTSPMTSSIPECSRVASLPGHSLSMPLYVDTTLTGRSSGHGHISSSSSAAAAATVPVLSLARPCSLPRTPSPEPATEAHSSHSVSSQGHVGAFSPVANAGDIAALPESPMWRPW